MWRAVSKFTFLYLSVPITGPTVWFQKFEYAVSHWLQKTAEHVIGCVLCSPGCFSLFRAEALMDDNVMKKYATKSTEASHYVQFDQGISSYYHCVFKTDPWFLLTNIDVFSVFCSLQGKTAGSVLCC